VTSSLFFILKFQKKKKDKMVEESIFFLFSLLFLWSTTFSQDTYVNYRQSISHETQASFAANEMTSTTSWDRLACYFYLYKFIRLEAIIPSKNEVNLGELYSFSIKNECFSRVRIIMYFIWFGIYTQQ
jgi:hypothetical protein